MKSTTLRHLFKQWQTTATPEQLAFVDSVFFLCEENYSRGGDTVCECFIPSEILDEFETLEDVKSYIGLKLDQEANARWGDDDDPQAKRVQDFEKNWKE